MEKTVKELCEEKWMQGACYRPLYLCSWILSYFGDHLILKDQKVCNEED